MVLGIKYIKAYSSAFLDFSHIASKWYLIRKKNQKVYLTFHMPKDFSEDVAVQGLPLDKIEESNTKKGKRRDLIFLCVVNMHNIKPTIFTMFKYTVLWH